jgi:hypothetical protein
MKTKVYSWRLSASLKTELERAARRRKVPVSRLIDLAARDWLAKNAADVSSEEEQRRIHAAAEKWIGAFASGNPKGSENVRQTVRKRLARKFARRSNAA